MKDEKTIQTVGTVTQARFSSDSRAADMTAWQRAPSAKLGDAGWLLRMASMNSKSWSQRKAMTGSPFVTSLGELGVFRNSVGTGRDSRPAPPFLPSWISL